jgi:hypothetical protein
MCGQLDVAAGSSPAKRGRGPPAKSGVPDLAEYGSRTRQQPSLVAVEGRAKECVSAPPPCFEWSPPAAQARNARGLRTSGFARWRSFEPFQQMNAGSVRSRRLVHQQPDRERSGDESASLWIFRACSHSILSARRASTRDVVRPRSSVPRRRLLSLTKPSRFDAGG